LGKYRTTISDLDRAGEAASKLPVAHLMRAHSYWNLKETDNAWQVLTNAETVFPENNSFTRQKIFFLLKLGLYQQVVETGNLYLVKYKAQAADYVAIGLGLLKAGEREKALLFLEKAGILFPGDGKVKLALAHTYAGNKQFNVAADLLTEVAIVNNKYVTDASELYRRAGRSMKALQIGMYSENEEKKLKQRLAIYLQAGLVDNIRALEDDLYRTGLIKKDDIRYALAYAMYRTGSYESAEEHLNKIRDSKIFRKAVSLRQAINECRVSLWKCY
ncbi:MAG: hypothetical protein KAU21_14965, partial [Gammaproteobacteria bacterium]|nr:hypothetical protein [Gammaproteobacteria bacterium]